MLDAFGFEGHPIGVRAVEHRVVGPELFDEAAVAWAARVGHDDAVIGALFGTATSEADLQRHAVSLSYRNPPGNSPARPWRARPLWPSFFIFFVMSAMSWYCLSRRLISGTEVPEPAAMRRRREALRSLGLRRSALVIDEMIASWRLMRPSSILASASLAASFSASSCSIVSAAFSTRPTTSPMSRMRPAMRSGWNGSMASI